MSRRYLLPVALGALLLGAVPALADANGSTEQRTEERSCSAEPDPHYSDPAPGDCTNPDGTPNPGGTYTATHWTNDVQCGSENALTPDNPAGITVYGSGDPAAQGGELSACSDGSAPVQGRAGLSGSTSEGYRVVVDGDKDNAPEQAQGYLVVEGGAGAPSYYCGKAYGEGGKADSETPEAGDDSSQCG